MKIHKSISDSSVSELLLALLLKANMQTRTNLTVSGKRFTIPETGGHCICASETHYIYAGVTKTGNIFIA